MSFVHNFYKSIYNVVWLKEQSHNSKAAWKYFLSLCFLLALVALLPVFVALPGIVKNIRSEVAALPSFQAALTNGELHVTGIKQPYTYTADDFVIVVDTSEATSSLESHIDKAKQSGLLIGKTGMQLYNAEGQEERTEAWKDIPNFSVDKAATVHFVNTFLNPAVVIAILLFIVIAAYFGLVISNLVSLLLVTLITWLLAKITRKGWKFKHLFNIGLFAITLPTLIAAAFAIFGVTGSYVYFLALLAFMIAVVFTDENSQAAVDDGQM